MDFRSTALIITGMALCNVGIHANIIWDICYDIDAALPAAWLTAIVLLGELRRRT